MPTASASLMLHVNQLSVRVAPGSRGACARHWHVADPSSEHLDSLQRLLTTADFGACRCDAAAADALRQLDAGDACCERLTGQHTQCVEASARAGPGHQSCMHAAPVAPALMSVMAPPDAAQVRARAAGCALRGSPTRRALPRSPRLA